MITEISENLYRITLPMPFRLRHVHAYALACGRRLTLFDAGMLMPGAYEKLAADLASRGFAVADIADIYLTHTHADHCGLVEAIQEKSGARLHLTEIARQVHAHFEEGGRLVAKARAFYARHGMSECDVAAVVEEIEDMKTRLPRLEVATLLRANEVRRAGNRTFEVIFTPGHAAGHVCFFFRDEGLLLAGDHILPYIPPSLSPNIDDEVFQPLSSYLASLTVIENLPVDSIHPGHGTSFSGVRERIDEIRAHHALKKEALVALIGRTGQTTFGICARLIGEAAAAWDDWEKFMALNETYVYLQQLKKDGRIRETLTSGVLYYSAA